jgi:hypothetical protein
VPGYEVSCLGRKFHAWVGSFVPRYEVSYLGMNLSENPTSVLETSVRRDLKTKRTLAQKLFE